MTRGASHGWGDANHMKRHEQQTPKNERQSQKPANRKPARRRQNKEGPGAARGLSGSPHHRWGAIYSAQRGHNYRFRRPIWMPQGVSFFPSNRHLFSVPLPRIHPAFPVCADSGTENNAEEAERG